MQQQTHIRRGRPPKLEHICTNCRHEYKSAQSLASHKKDAKRGKVKCAPVIVVHPQTNLVSHQPLGPKSMANFQLPNLFTQTKFKEGSRPTSITKTSVNAETIQDAIHDSPEWASITDLYQSGRFNLPQSISETYGHAFFLKGTSYKNKDQRFAQALCRIIEKLDLRVVPRFLLEPYCDFFKNFIPDTTYSNETLRKLYDFAREIDAPMNWLFHCERPLGIIRKDGWISSDPQLETARVFTEQKWLYSAPYFKIADEIMASHHTCSCIYETVENYFTLIQSQENPATDISKEQILRYSGFERQFGFETLETCTKNLNEEAGCSFNNEQLICLLGFCCKYSYDIVKQIINQVAPETDIGTIGDQVENIAQRDHVFKKLEEEKEIVKAQELLRIQSHQKQLKLQGEKKQRELEEQKAKDQKETQLKMEVIQKQNEEIQTQMKKVLRQVLSKNETLECAFEDINAFQSDLQEIATTIKVTLRPEQLVTMGLLFKSQEHTTLIQLATGTGKSLMLGILAAFIFKNTGKRVLVIVPTQFLHAYQEHYYCPEASQIPERICDDRFPGTFYCSYERFNAPGFVVPADTVVLIDEFHEFFFDQKIQIHESKIISHISKLLNATKVIGVSATYRGDAGLYKIESILKELTFIQPTKELKERKLQLEVFGETEDILERAVKLAQDKSKQMPVIIFCNDITEYKILIPEAKVFDDSLIGEANSLLQLFKTSTNSIVLTTSNSCKGVDFNFAVPQAFVIHTCLPNSFVQLQQDSGRGVRGADLPIIGAIFTERMYFTLEDVELGLKHQEQFDKLYPADYIQSLNFLQEKQEVVKTVKQIEALHLAVDTLNNGGSLQLVQQCFAKVRLTQQTNFLSGQQVTLNADCDLVAHQNLPEEQRGNATVNSTEQLLGKRKQEPKQDDATQVLEEEKSGAVCLQTHKKHFKSCNNSTKKSKHCDSCNTAAIRSQNKYWYCDTCGFNICDGCSKQGKIGSLFFLALPAAGTAASGTLKRQKRDEAAEEVLKEQQHQEQEQEQEQEHEVSAFQDEIVIENNENQQVDPKALK